MSWTPPPAPGQPVDRWLIVWVRENGKICVDPQEESRIDAAVEKWICRQGDTLLHLSILGGAGQMTYKASEITGWELTTPEMRALEALQEARDKDEKRANRQAAGLPYDED